MSEPKFEHTGAYCRDNGGGYDPDCWACDPSHFARALDAARAEGKAEGSAAEREACAEVAEVYRHIVREGDAHEAVARYSNRTCELIAAAIRARGDA